MEMLAAGFGFTLWYALQCFCCFSTPFKSPSIPTHRFSVHFCPPFSEKTPPFVLSLYLSSPACHCFCSLPCLLYLSCGTLRSFLLSFKLSWLSAACDLHTITLPFLSAPSLCLLLFPWPLSFLNPSCIPSHPSLSPSLHLLSPPRRLISISLLPDAPSLLPLLPPFPLLVLPQATLLQLSSLIFLSSLFDKAC
ncbi:hypothetical protein C8R44DRAFT_52154 [Mycena epipterygia]|nr:hypothetical protein C8R44DRAFT_52154 [Mycena epipterygia]